MTVHKLPQGYSVDCAGRVFSATGWRGSGLRELSQHPNSHGYLSVRVVFPGGIRKRMLVHALVAAYFLPKRPSPSHEVCHIDGDMANNAANNLRWGTRKDNAADRDYHGRTSKGAAHSAAIRAGRADALTEVERRCIFRLNASGWTQRAIAERLGRSQGAVGAVIKSGVSADSAIAKATGKQA